MRAPGPPARLLLALVALLALAGPARGQAAPSGEVATYLDGQVVRTVPALTGGRELEVRLVGGALVRVVDDQATFKPGERIEVYRTLDPNGKVIYYASDYLRRGPLLVLALLFVAVAVAVGRGKGARAVVGMALSLAVILLGIVPAIIAGWSPVLVALLGASLILVCSVYFVHGVNWTTTAALTGTIVAAGLALGLAVGFTDLAHLSGYGTENALLIQQSGAQVNLRGLLIAGMIIGSLGALVDSTIAQAAVVRELSSLNPGLSRRGLYRSGMGVGFDHIGSLVNTLVLAYAGSSLPLFVLFNLGGFGFNRAVNMELVAAEIVHALVGSIGLILAVPLSTLIAAWLFAGNRLPGGLAEAAAQGHGHLPLGPGGELGRAIELPVRERSRLLDEPDALLGRGQRAPGGRDDRSGPA